MFFYIEQEMNIYVVVFKMTVIISRLFVDSGH